MTLGSYSLVLGLAALGLTGGGLATGSARAADFYAGKTINFIVGQTAGSAADLDCRVLAQSMGDYVAGKPSIIVKNMVSTDSLTADNYVGREAKADGLTALCGQYNANTQLLKNPALRVDLTKFNYITGDGDVGVFYVRSDVPPGIKTGADFFKAEGLILAGNSVDATYDITVRTYFKMLGIDNYKYVTGFSGSGAAKAAIQQKFVNMYQESMSGFIAVTLSTLVKDGTIVPLFQTGLADASGNLTVRDPRMPGLPTFSEFYQAKFGIPPSGTGWDLENRVHGANNIGLNAVMLPPGSPDAAVSALRAAIGPMSRDPGFLSAYGKLHGEGIVPSSGDTVEAAVHNFLDMPPTLLAFYNDMIKSGTALEQKAK